MKLSCPGCLMSFEPEDPSGEVVCPHCGEVVAAVDRASAETAQTPPGAPGHLDDTVTYVRSGGRLEAAAAAVDCPVCGREIPLERDTSQRVECSECGTSFIPAKALEAARRRPTPGLSEGSMLGPYRLGERLGAGGMGIVYKGVHSVLRREAAVKVLAPAIAQDPEHRERFLREARLAAALDHPGIAKVFEASYEEDILYIAMEYIPGRTLEDMVEDRGRLDPAEAAKMVFSACAALQVAHEAGILHRDVKPGNVMVSDLGEVKITDFGIARRLKASTILTEPGAIIGTPGYIAPEQFEGKELDPRSDIYSLGATFYLLLTGEPPYADEDPLTVFLRRRWEQVRPANELVPEIPQALSDIAAKMLAKSPPQRYASCEAVARDLRAFLDGEDVSVEVPTGEVPRHELPFGVVALREKLVTEDQLLRCVRIQESLRAGGREAPPIGTIMVQHGLISPEKMSMVLGLQRISAKPRCPICGRALGSDAMTSGRYLCPFCHGRERPPPQVDVSSAKGTVVVRVSAASLDYETVRQLNAIMEGVAHRRKDRVVLDISRLGSVSADDASGILGWADVIRQQRKQFKIVCGTKARAVFDRIGLSGMVTVEVAAPRGREAKRKLADEDKDGAGDVAERKHDEGQDAFEPKEYEIVGSVVKFRCRCGKRVSAPLHVEHSEGRCPQCGVRLVLPTGAAPEGASSPASETADIAAGLRTADVQVPATPRLAWARTLTKSCRRFLAGITRRSRLRERASWRWAVVGGVSVAILVVVAFRRGRKEPLPKPGEPDTEVVVRPTSRDRVRDWYQVGVDRGLDWEKRVRSRRMKFTRSQVIETGKLMTSDYAKNGISEQGEEAFVRGFTDAVFGE